MMNLEKCVKLESNKLSFREHITLENCLDAYLKCKNYFYDLLCGDKYMVKIQNASKLRTELSKNQIAKGQSYQELLHVPQRYWVMPLFDVCANLNSNWSNLKIFLKKRIRENENLNDDEQKYCYVILNDRQLWFNVLHWLPVKDKYLDSLNLTITEQRKKSLNNVIRRITKENMFTKPHSDTIRCMWLDSSMYSYSDKFGKTKFSFSTIEKNKPLEIKLKGIVKFPRTGNIQVIYDRDKNVIELHKLIKITIEDQKHTNEEGIDKGYATLLSCSNGKEYGENIGIQFTSNAQWLNAQTEIRNFYSNLCKKLEKEKEVLLIKMRKSNIPQEKEYLLTKVKQLTKKIKNIKTNNMGKKKFNKNYNRKKEYCKQSINHYIKQLFLENDIKLLGVEDLSFVNHMAPFKGRKFNRKMSYWLKGYTEERIEYIGKEMNCKIQKVNAAETSKFCSDCGAELLGRKGKHNEIAICPNCGEINSNVNSGKAVRSRLHDKEITLYTPYKKVKQIMRDRYKNKQQNNKNNLK